MQLSETVFQYIFRYGYLIAGLAGLVIGIIIAVGKTKPTRVLGIGYAASSVTLMESTASLVLNNYVGVRVVASVITTINIINVGLSICHLLCICIYLHKNYGKKLVYIPVFLIHIGYQFMGVLVNLIIGKVNSGVMIANISKVYSFLYSLVLALFIVIVFASNKNKEKIIPSFWKFQIIGEIIKFVNLVLFIVTNSMSNKPVNISPELIRFILDILMTGIVVTEALSSLIVPIYVLRASRNLITD